MQNRLKNRYKFEHPLNTPNNRSGTLCWVHFGANLGNFGANLGQLGPQNPPIGANMANKPPLGTNMASGAPNLEPTWAQDPSNWPQLGPNPPKFKPKSIQKVAQLYRVGFWHIMLT